MSDENDWAEKQAEIEEAWRQPAFSHETIAADAWTAVYLPIPVDADRELLKHARGWADDLQRYADPEIQNRNALNAFDAPLSGPAESHSLVQHCEAAGARCAEITTRIARLDVNDLSRDAEGTAEAAETMQSPMTVEAIARDPWNAVVLDLPENGTRELYVSVADAAHMLRSVPEAEMPAPPFPLPTDDLGWSELGEEIKSRMKNAESKIHEIDFAAGRAEVMGMIAERPEIAREAEPANENTAAATIEAARIVAGNEEAAEVAPSQPVRGFFSFSGAAENFLSDASRTVSFALNVVIGFFVDEPKMTGQQVHDTLQAAGNVETLHAREYAAAEAVEAGEHDFRMMMMKGGQQEHDLRLAMTLGTNPTAEANLGLDEHEASRREELAL